MKRLVACVAAACAAGAAFAAAERNPHVAIGVNQMGWRPDSPKWCRVENPPSMDYVVETIGTDVTWRIVHRGRWVKSVNSNGTFFADITQAAAKPGDYSVLCGRSPIAMPSAGRRNEIMVRTKL